MLLPLAEKACCFGGRLIGAAFSHLLADCGPGSHFRLFACVLTLCLMWEVPLDTEGVHSHLQECGECYASFTSQAYSLQYHCSLSLSTGLCFPCLLLGTSDIFVLTIENVYHEGDYLDRSNCFVSFKSPESSVKPDMGVG